MTALDDALWPRAALPRRPMLGGVLDALVEHDVGETPSQWLAMPGCTIAVGAVGAAEPPREGVHFVVPRDLSRVDLAVGRDARRRWVTTDPAEAYELLQARGLIPMSYVGRFVCEACGGKGYRDTPTPLGDVVSHRCYSCSGTAHRPHPPTVAALASWASLGFAAGDDGAPGILGAEELAQELVPIGPLVWWVGELPPPLGAETVRRFPAAARLQGAGVLLARCGAMVTLNVPPLGLVTP